MLHEMIELIERKEQRRFPNQPSNSEINLGLIFWQDRFS